MQNLYTISTGSGVGEEKLTEAEIFSVLYHNFFDYPLSFSEMIRWRAGKFPKKSIDGVRVSNKNGYAYIEGKEGIVFKRMLRKRISAKKLEIAKGASKILSFLPGVKMIAVTGSLAMGNASDESDIDLMVITKSGSLWTTRAFAYLLICLFGIKKRTPNKNYQKDALCLNMWLDESDLVWQKKDRNIYTAHEIGQILPLINEDKTYEKFLYENRWILKFWPNAVRVQSIEYKVQSENFLSTMYHVLGTLWEPIFFWLQYQHMRSKITREVVTPTRALFHPQDWGRVVIGRLTT
jgi:predicted nucleotidyltransferase